MMICDYVHAAINAAKAEAEPLRAKARLSAEDSALSSYDTVAPLSVSSRVAVSATFRTFRECTTTDWP